MADGESTGPVATYVAPKERSHIMKLAGAITGQTPDGSDGSIVSNSLQYEDEFRALYGGWAQAPRASILRPPTHPKTLQALCQQNNTLMNCISAWVTNVHETGYEVRLKDPKAAAAADPTAPVDPNVQKVQDFFSEVWPGKSFQQLRKATGIDREQTGNAYWEVLRNLKRELVMIRQMETKLTRMVALSDPIEVPVTVMRGGASVTLKVWMRYRRFVQSIGLKYVFYKEYGCPLLINKNTGDLLEDNAANRILLYKTRAMGTEVLHFRGMEDVDTPYGVPTWYPQMPSVLGSRKAEEFNLEYFEAGGVPPLMIFVQGGTMGSTMKTALEEFLSSKPGAKQGAPVFEIQSTGGTLDSPGAGAKVTVERFDQGRQKDSMFENYDNKCEERVRRAWRLPPIFVGMANDYNLATAQASYAVAEAQVFKPERDDFDEVINKTIIRELVPDGSVIMRSMGLPVKDVNQQLLAITQAFLADALSVGDFVDLLNEVTALSMKVRPEAADEHQTKIDAKLDLMVNAAHMNVQPALGNAGATPPAVTNAAAPKGKGSASAPSNSSPKAKVVATKADDPTRIGATLNRQARLMLHKALADPEKAPTFRDAIKKMYDKEYMVEDLLDAE